MARHATLLGVVVVLTMGWPVPSTAQSRRPKDPTPNPPPQGWEQWRDPVPVSGGLRVGVMSEPGASFTPVQMTVWLPETVDKPVLCVEVSSQDGRYVAALAYDVRGESGPVVLNLPASRYGPRLRGMAPAQLAILARLAKSCGKVPAEPGAFVVAGWNQPQVLGDKVLVLLNSRLPTSIAAGSGNRIEREHRCLPLEGTTTAFNLRCEIPVGDIREGRQFVIRMGRGSSVTPVPLPLSVPAQK